MLHHQSESSPVTRPDQHGELDVGHNLPGQDQLVLQLSHLLPLLHHGEDLQLVQGVRFQDLGEDRLDMVTGQCAVVQLHLPQSFDKPCQGGWGDQEHVVEGEVQLLHQKALRARTAQVPKESFKLNRRQVGSLEIHLQLSFR